MSVDKKTTGESDQDLKLTLLNNQVNNIDNVGKILTEEANIIHSYMRDKNIIISKDQSDYKKQLTNIVIALGVCAKYFEGKITGLENEIKKLTDK